MFLELQRKAKAKPGTFLPNMWTDECEQNFRELKRTLTSAPILAFADFTKPFVVEVDGSHQGLGAVLSQENLEASSLSFDL